jgi:hypothetical protein
MNQNLGLFASVTFENLVGEQYSATALDYFQIEVVEPVALL